MEEILRAVGLGTPVYMAAGTYGFFRWLDQNASGVAKRAVSQWLAGHAHERVDFGAAIITAFDRIYSTPLFRFRAFFRSAIISVFISILIRVIWAVWFNKIDVAINMLSEAAAGFSAVKFFVMLMWSIILPIVISDYVSLFVVRKSLILAQASPIKSLALAFTVGSIAIIVSCFISTVIGWYVFGGFSLEFLLDSLQYFFSLDPVFAISLFIGTMLPALLIHLWLVLFGLASLIARLVYLVLRSLEIAVWFQKQSNNHPIRAIGMVAAGLTLITTGVGKELLHLL